MPRWMTALILAGAACFWAPPALPCGGGFGMGLSIGTSQKIFVSHKNGVETYFFSPRFCGNAASFGLILPIPSTLSSDPVLGETTLITEFEDVTKPEMKQETACRSKGGYGGSAGAGLGHDAGGVTVIDKGQVGIFEWSLLQATETKSFTDWLDANSYPYDAKAVPAFQYYVDSAWYFVAFKISADTQAPPPGQQLCGSLGPLQLSFATDAPVVPARIAAAAETSSYGAYAWRLFLVADKQLTVGGAEMSSLELRYSGALTSDDLANHAALSKVSQGATPILAQGDRLTELEVRFAPSTLTKDLQLVAEPNPKDFRRVLTEYTYIDCPDGGLDGGGGGQTPPAEDDSSGCATGRGPLRAEAIGLVLALGLLLARRRRD